MKITRYAEIKTEYHIIKRFDTTSICRGGKVSNIRRVCIDDAALEKLSV